MTDSDAVLDALHLGIDCRAAQLDDDRWVWLPALLAGRVFKHRVGANEAVDPGGALLLEPGTLAALGAAAGDLVGLRLTTAGLALERVGMPPSGADAGVGALLADTLDADEPRFFPEAVWTACVDDPALFAQPLAPLREIADHHGLAHRGDWLAPAGFDFDAWDLDRGCALLASRHDLDLDDAFALFMLIKLHEQMELTLLSVDPDEPLKDAVPGAAEDATQPGTDPFIELGGRLGAALADPLLAQLLVAEIVDTDPAGAASAPWV